MNTDSVHEDMAGETPFARLLRSKPYSQAAVARELGISPWRLSRLKTGGSAVLTAAEAVRAARLFGVPVEELVPDEEEQS